MTVEWRQLLPAELNCLLNSTYWLQHHDPKINSWISASINRRAFPATPHQCNSPPFMQPSIYSHLLCGLASFLKRIKQSVHTHVWVTFSAIRVSSCFCRPLQRGLLFSHLGNSWPQISLIFTHAIKHTAREGWGGGLEEKQLLFSSPKDKKSAYDLALLESCRHLVGEQTRWLVTCWGFQFWKSYKYKSQKYSIKKNPSSMTVYLDKVCQQAACLSIKTIYCSWYLAWLHRSGLVNISLSGSDC